MAKFYGEVGYAKTEETSPGVWTEKIEVRNYYGDVLQHTRRLENGQSINDDVVLNNRFSIVADAYAYQYMGAIRYVKWMGVLWKISTVEVQGPRLLLTTGGVYNGPTT